MRDRGPLVGVGELSANSVGGGISVDGWATFSGQKIVSATDPPDDGGSGAGPAGGELTGASFTYRPEQEDLLVGADLASLPLPPVAGSPGVLYGFALQVGGASYEVRALRAAATAVPPAAPHFALYRCAPGCTQQALLSGSIGTTGTGVLVSVPLSALGAQEGAVLTGLRAFTALGEVTPGALMQLRR